MEIKRTVGPLEIKAIDDSTGRFEGYGSVFGNVDSYGDIVVKGAFTDFLQNNAAKNVKLLWQHDSAQPIGTYDQIYEDEKGLYVKGNLLVNDVAKAREAYALLKSGAISGLSIGYSINHDGVRIGDDGYNYLTDLKLWEISVVTFPANNAAQVDAIKRAYEIHTIRDFERHLREVGFSQQKAKAIAANGFKKAIEHRDDDQELMLSLSKLTNTINGVNQNEHRSNPSS